MKKPVVSYARVSSKDQEREGFSIPAQRKLLMEYANARDLRIVKEFVDIETAKQIGRKQFGEMVRYFEKHSDCRTVIAEKTDRLYRNYRDSLTLEDLGVEIHLVKDGLVLSKESKSQEKLIHGFHLLIAKNYSDNLREEVKKGMREKAAQGILPTRAPFGYRNNRLERTIEPDPEKASIVQRFFELYATGQHSLRALGKDLRARTCRKMSQGQIHRILRNSFYIGLLTWEGKTYPGKHARLISPDLFERAQQVFERGVHSKQRKHNFPFAGMLTCAYDHCAVTAEEKKGRYVYYHCTGYHGKCALPYMREEKLGVRLGQVLEDIQIPDAILDELQERIRKDQQQSDVWRKQECERLQKRLFSVRSRMDQAYLDKLDGKISEDFWQRRTADWQQEEQQLLMALAGVEQAGPDRVLTASRILELANKAHSLYLRQNPTEQAKLLKLVLSNCAIDRTNLYPTYRKPFDLIFNAAKRKEWWAWGDSNSRPPV